MVFWEGAERSYRWGRDSKCFLLGLLKGSAFEPGDNPPVLALTVDCASRHRQPHPVNKANQYRGGGQFPPISSHNPW